MACLSRFCCILILVPFIQIDLVSDMICYTFLHNQAFEVSCWILTVETCEKTYAWVQVNHCTCRHHRIPQETSLIFLIRSGGAAVQVMTRMFMNISHA